MTQNKIYDAACLMSEVEFLRPLSTKTLLMIAQEIVEVRCHQISDKLKSILHIDKDERFDEEVENLSFQLSKLINNERR